MPVGPPRTDDLLASHAVDEAIAALRALLLAGQLYRQRAADHLGVWIMDSFALSYLAGSGPMTAGELARNLGITPSSVTSLVDRLESNGFAQRRPRPADRRVVEISITARGENGVNETSLSARRAMLDLGAEDLAATTRTLARLAEALNERSAGLTNG